MSARTLALLFLATGLMAVGLAGPGTEVTIWTAAMLISWIVAFIAGMSAENDER